MKQIQYIDKSYPITLQDLIDLAKAHNQDPRDLKITLNDSDPDYTGYTQCAVLNQDQGKISLELYTHKPTPIKPNQIRFK